METPEQYTVKTPELPEKIYPVNYAGFWDFSLDGCYDASPLNEMDFPNAGEIAAEVSKRYNGYSELIKENERLREDYTPTKDRNILLFKENSDLREENKLYREALTETVDELKRVFNSSYCSVDDEDEIVKKMETLLSKFQPKKDESIEQRG